MDAHTHTHTTHDEHGAEVAEVIEELLHRGLLGVDGEELHHALVLGVHVPLQNNQLGVLLPCVRGKAVIPGQGRGGSRAIQEYQGHIQATY